MGLIDETPVPISQYEKEFEFLLRIYEERRPMKVLEIGTHHGGSLYHWIKNAPDGAVVNSIDNQHLNSDLYDDWADNHRVEVNWFKGDSASYQALEWAAVDAQYDFIFIDGDHSYDGVFNDWMLAHVFSNHKAIIAFHDITPHPNREVNLFWEKHKTYYIWEEVVDLSYPEDERCGIGIVYLD